MPRLLAINQTYFQRLRRRAAQWRRLRRAHERIWIPTPYFVPLGRVSRRLIRAARSGIDVRVMVPAQSDVWVVPWISYSYLWLLDSNGVKVFEYQPKFLHQKLYLMDQWICLGSTNLNNRSFLHDLEIDVVITEPQNKITLESQFTEDQKQSIRFDGKLWNSFPIWKKASFWILRSFSYWS